MSQKLSVNGFQWVEYLSEFDEGFIKCYNEKSKEGYFLEVDIQYPENLHHVQNDLTFLPERMNNEKVEKLAADWHDKIEYLIHMKNLKQVLNHGLVLKKVPRVI